MLESNPLKSNVSREIGRMACQNMYGMDVDTRWKSRGSGMDVA